MVTPAHAPHRPKGGSYPREQRLLLAILEQNHVKRRVTFPTIAYSVCECSYRPHDAIVDRDSRLRQIEDRFYPLPYQQLQPGLIIIYNVYIPNK